MNGKQGQLDKTQVKQFLWSESVPVVDLKLSDRHMMVHAAVLMTIKS